MTYKTIDIIEDLLPSMMVGAQKLTFTEYKPATGSNTEGWDTEAVFSTTDSAATPHFSWTATQGMNYDLASFSGGDPSMLVVYDEQGNALAASEKDSDNHSAFLNDFVAPYSGTFYVSAGWVKGGDAAAGVVIYGDKESVPAPGAIAPYALNGTTGDDAMVASAFKENINGGAGFDSLSYAGKRDSVKFIKSGDTLTLTPKTGGDLADAVTNIEQLKFADKSIDLKYNDVTQALYVAYFGRAADTGGLASFQSQLASLNAPTTVNELAAKYKTDANIKGLIDSFGTSDESKALYSGDTKAFVNAIFTNVLNRAPNPSGLEFWTKAIDSGELTRANASLSIMAGAQTNTTTQGWSDKALVANKIDIASNFTFALDTPEKAAVYSTASAAASVRELLASVSPWSNVPNFQKEVDSTVLQIGTPKTALDQASHASIGQADGMIDANGVVHPGPVGSIGSINLGVQLGASGNSSVGSIGYIDANGVAQFPVGSIGWIDLGAHPGTSVNGGVGSIGYIDANGVAQFPVGSIGSIDLGAHSGTGVSGGVGAIGFIDANGVSHFPAGYIDANGVTQFPVGSIGSIDLGAHSGTGVNGGVGAIGFIDANGVSHFPAGYIDANGVAQFPVGSIGSIDLGAHSGTGVSGGVGAIGFIDANGVSHFPVGYIDANGVAQFPVGTIGVINLNNLADHDQIYALVNDPQTYVVVEQSQLYALQGDEANVGAQVSAVALVGQPAAAEVAVPF